MNKVFIGICTFLCIIIGIRYLYLNSPSVFITSIYNVKTLDNYYNCRIVKSDEYAGTLSSAPAYFNACSKVDIEIIRKEAYKDGYYIVEYSVTTDRGSKYVGTDLWSTAKGRTYRKTLNLTCIESNIDVAC